MLEISIGGKKNYEGLFQKGGNGGQLKISCQSQHFARIQGMKNIWKPPFPIQICLVWQNLSAAEFRRSPCFSSKNSLSGHIQQVHVQLFKLSYIRGLRITDLKFDSNI